MVCQQLNASYDTEQFDHRNLKKVHCIPTSSMKLVNLYSIVVNGWLIGGPILTMIDLMLTKTD